MIRALKTMNPHIGKRALVVGAGIAGLAIARALSDSFQEVIVLERDSLSDQPIPRPGVPQGRHPHLLLASAMIALNDLFPGIAVDLARAGAVEVNPGLDVLMELPGVAPLPRCDFGRNVYAMSRPLLELVLRRRLGQYRNVALHQRCRVLGVLGSPDGSTVTGAQYQTPSGTARNILADLVVDASANGEITSDFLRHTGMPMPEETILGLDLHCSSATFAAPKLASDFKVIMTYSSAAEDGRYGCLTRVEDNRWQVLLAGRGERIPLADSDEFLAYAQQLETTTIYNAIEDAECVSAISQSAFQHSVWRHFAQLSKFPLGLIPIGDAICRLNPFGGHGMAVALQQANMLHHLLQMEPIDSHPLETLARTFISEAEALIEDPWALSTLSDFVSPETRGKRQSDREDKLNFHGALHRVALRDPEVHKLLFEVSHLLKPINVFDHKGS